MVASRTWTAFFVGEAILVRCWIIPPVFCCASFCPLKILLCAVYSRRTEQVEEGGVLARITGTGVGLGVKKFS